jgi:hypothetical protein
MHAQNTPTGFPISPLLPIASVVVGDHILGGRLSTVGPAL